MSTRPHCPATNLAHTGGALPLVAAISLLCATCAPHAALDRRVLTQPPPPRLAAQLDPQPDPQPDPQLAPQAAASAPTGPAGDSPFDNRRWVEGDGPVAQPQVRWRTQLGAPLTLPLTVGDTGLWVVAGGRVALLDSRGERLFSVDLAAVTQVSLSTGGPHVGIADGSLLRLSPSTGATVQRWTGSGRSRGAAVPLGSDMVWAGSSGQVHHTQGTNLAQLLTVTASPAADADQVYFQTQSNQLVALASDGPRWSSPVPGPGASAPIVGHDLVFAAWDGAEGASSGVLAVTRDSGELVWSQSLPAAPGLGMALDGQRLLVPLSDGGVLSLDPQTGGRQWALRLGDSPITTAPLIEGSSAWLGDAAGRVHRIDLDDGGAAWSVDLGSPVTSGPQLAWGLILVGLASGELVALGPAPS